MIEVAIQADDDRLGASTPKFDFDERKTDSAAERQRAKIRRWVIGSVDRLVRATT